MTAYTGRCLLEPEGVLLAMKTIQISLPDIGLNSIFLCQGLIAMAFITGPDNLPLIHRRGPVGDRGYVVRGAMAVKTKGTIRATILYDVFPMDTVKHLSVDFSMALIA